MKEEICTCGHSIDSHIQPDIYEGSEGIIGECDICDCGEYEEEILVTA